MRESVCADDAERLIKGVLNQERTALARTITLIEDESPCAEEILKEAFRHRGNSKIVGLTGAPGVGKSSLVDNLVSIIRDEGSTVGIIAVDPSSPFTGGAILGDRVRMRSRTTDEGVFFRSLASRGHLGGLSRHTGDVVTLMDAFGFDYILIETVGTGQSEVDIMLYAHTVVVVLAPGMGDDIQAIKAGILEIGDVFCVNKADHPGADKTVSVIESMLELNKDWKWKPPVVKTVAAEQVGVEDLLEQIKSHLEYLRANDLMDKRVSRSYRASLEENIRRETVDKVLRCAIKDGVLDVMLDEMLKGKSDPVTCARELVRKYLCGKEI
ncbi:MAG: methylmalonyl Co-A mutase-associated GTPase MeaB [Bacillota bacterium]